VRVGGHESYQLCIGEVYNLREDERMSIVKRVRENPLIAGKHKLG